MISKKKKKKKKKGLRQNSRRFFSQNFASSNVSGGALFAWGGLFSIFHRKSASKAQKTCDFAYFTSQWGGLEPPPPPPLATLLAITTIYDKLLDNLDKNQDTCAIFLDIKKAFESLDHKTLLKELSRSLWFSRKIWNLMKSYLKN